MPAAFARSRCLTPRHDSVSSRRSSNRTCGFPASGSRTRSCLRPRKARRMRRKARETKLFPESLGREPHFFPGPHLVLAAQPLAQPPGRVPVDRRVGRADLPQGEVVRPAGQPPVQARHHNPRRQEPVARRRQRAHSTANALDAFPTRTGADVGGARYPAGSCDQSGSRGTSSVPPAPGSSGSSQRSSAASDASSGLRPPPASPLPALGPEPRSRPRS